MILNAEKISKKYYRPTRNSSHFEAVKALDFSIEKGKITEVTGRSGSGKSTLLYMLSGLLKPDTGKVIFNCDGTEKDLYSLSDRELSILRNRKFGLIPQGQTGIYSLSLLQNVLLPSMLYGNTEKYEKHALELLELAGLSELASARMNELSGGEMRRMAVVRSLLMDPEIIFADEPTVDLDDENTVKVLELLRKTADSGKAVFLVTHEAMAEKYADRVYRMDGGLLTEALKG